MQALPVRKQFAIQAPSAPELELRLHWFGRALEVRRGYIVGVERQRRGSQHVACIAYELPLPSYGRRARGRRGAGRQASALVAGHAGAARVTGP